MARYIDADEVYEIAKTECKDFARSIADLTSLRELLEDTPTADVQEVRHGEWMETQEPLGWRDVDCAECSVCHENWIIDEDSSIDDYECMWHYCPNCGAKMDGDTNYEL